MYYIFSACRIEFSEVTAVVHKAKSTIFPRNAKDLQIYIKLSIFFLTGCVLGCVFNSRLDGAVPGTAQLRDNFVSAVSGHAVGLNTADELFGIYVFPLLSVILGYMTFGVLILPLLIGIRGFLLSYSISSLAASYGLSGLSYCCLTVLPVQIFALPCLLGLCCECTKTSGALMCFSLGKFPEFFPVYDRTFYMSVLGSFFCLIIPFAIKLFVIPVMISMVY